ncbi:unnamed protein product [Rotaria sp. Silwood1]|nr:unnamed protein product [Rotaria sp. Silwood1]CAF3657146.1 unnamed protein product [Rotaria sp. Silwood1]CAF4784324.1 unnamed protein product [Rotaria sp. Silwood1]
MNIVSESHNNHQIRLGKVAIDEIYNENANNVANRTDTNPIQYQTGARVLTGPTKIHIVYYGNWTTAQMNIVNTFIATIGNTAWFNIEKSYYYQATSISSKVYTTGPLTLGSITTDHYSYGTQLSDSSIPNIIYNHIRSGQLQNDPHGIYLLLSAADVKEGYTSTSSFCTTYCGYHSAFSIGSTTYIYGFIGNPQNCMSTCSVWNRVVSPNGDTGVDAMLSPIAHEIVEAMSDPLLNAWLDSKGDENADKCAWTYGTTYRLGNGAYYNITANGKYYLIQQNWNANRQTCAMSV